MLRFDIISDTKHQQLKVICYTLHIGFFVATSLQLWQFSFSCQVNKCTTAVRILIDPSELPVCDCTADSENSCGADCNCLNRMLQFECNPQTCPSKENCHNQRFQKRQYVDCEAFRTLHRGWGLRCKQGEWSLWL